MNVESFSKINLMRKNIDVIIVDISIGKGMKWIKAKDMIHEPRLAPTQELLDGYKNGEISEEEYIVEFDKLFREREMDKIIEEYIDLYGDSVYFCCFCGKGKFCHRNLLKQKMEGGN